MLKVAGNNKLSLSYSRKCLRSLFYCIFIIVINLLSVWIERAHCSYLQMSCLSCIWLYPGIYTNLFYCPGCDVVHGSAQLPKLYVKTLGKNKH